MVNGLCDVERREEDRKSKSQETEIKELRAKVEHHEIRMGKEGRHIRSTVLKKRDDTHNLFEKKNNESFRVSRWMNSAQDDYVMSDVWTSTSTARP